MGNSLSRAMSGQLRRASHVDRARTRAKFQLTLDARKSRVDVALVPPRDFHPACAQLRRDGDVLCMPYAASNRTLCTLVSGLDVFSCLLDASAVPWSVRWTFAVGGTVPSVAETCRRPQHFDN